MVELIVPEGAVPGQNITFIYPPPVPMGTAVPQPGPPPLSPRAQQEEEELKRALEASTAELVSKQPQQPDDIHSPEPVIDLFDEYRRGKSAALYEAKLGALSRIYSRVRRIRGEGNCFYRSMWTGWVERMLVCLSSKEGGHPLVSNPFHSEWATQIRDLSSSAKDQLPPPQGDEVVRLGDVFVERTRNLCRAYKDEGEPALLKAARQHSETADALRWLRLMASSQIRSRREDFEPFALAAGYDSLAAFCVGQVEADETLADEPQIEGLTCALGIGVRVEYLVDTAADWSQRCGPHRHILCMPSAPDGAPPNPLAACILFRPGHYDMLMPMDWTNKALLEATGERLIPPLPPPKPIPGQVCDSCRRFSHLQGCWLCEKSVCTSPKCPATAAAMRDAPPNARPNACNLYPLPAYFEASEREGGICTDCILRCPTFNIHAPDDENPRPPRVGSHALWRCAGCQQLGTPSFLRDHQAQCRSLQPPAAIPATRTSSAPATIPPARVGSDPVAMDVDQKPAAGEAAVEATLSPPAIFCCPLTKKVMKDPVIAADGVTYEREAFNGYLQRSRKSPVTFAALEHTYVEGNSALRATIDKWLEKHQLTGGAASSGTASVQKEAAATATGGQVAQAGSAHNVVRFESLLFPGCYLHVDSNSNNMIIFHKEAPNAGSVLGLLQVVTLPGSDTVCTIESMDHPGCFIEAHGEPTGERASVRFSIVDAPMHSTCRHFKFHKKGEEQDVVSVESVLLPGFFFDVFSAGGVYSDALIRLRLVKSAPVNVNRWGWLRMHKDKPIEGGTSAAGGVAVDPRTAAARAAEARLAKTNTLREEGAAAAAATTQEPGTTPGGAATVEEATDQLGKEAQAQVPATPPPPMSDHSGSSQGDLDDDSEVQRLIAQTGTAEASKLRGLRLKELKERASYLGITEPDGHLGHKKTWVKAILMYHEVIAAAKNATAEAQPHQPSAEEIAAAGIEKLERTGHKKLHAEEAMQMAGNEYELASRLLDDIERFTKIGYAWRDAATALRIAENDFSKAHVVLRKSQGEAASDLQPAIGQHPPSTSVGGKLVEGIAKIGDAAKSFGGALGIGGQSSGKGDGDGGPLSSTSQQPVGTAAESDEAMAARLAREYDAEKAEREEAKKRAEADVQRTPNSREGQVCAKLTAASASPSHRGRDRAVGRLRC